MNETITVKTVFFSIVVLFSIIAAGFLAASIEPDEFKTVEIKISAVSPCRSLVDISPAKQPIDIFDLMRENDCFPSNEAR